MNENNRRGGKGVCYSRSRGGRTGNVEIHQLHQLMNLTRCGCASFFFFLSLRAKRTENDTESPGLRAAVWHNVCGPSRSSGAHWLALLSLNKWRKSTVRDVKQVHGGEGDTYLYATVHNVESINRIAYQNSIQKRNSAMSKRRLCGLLHNIYSLLIQVRLYPCALFPSPRSV